MILTLKYHSDFENFEIKITPPIQKWDGKMQTKESCQAPKNYKLEMLKIMKCRHIIFDQNECTTYHDESSNNDYSSITQCA